jgi:aryl-alcohol dehydrogenase-like predicted oxidoreductase
MERRPLGRTGLSVTPLGLGLAAVGRPAYINLGRALDLPPGRTPEALGQRADQLLDRAYALGVRYFDVARSYGLAEDFLGSWLGRREPLPEAVVCGSKWGYTYVGEWRMDAPVHEVKEHSLATLRRQLQESRERLGAHLQLYQVHSATIESGILENLPVLAELVRIRADGITIGLTVSGPDQARVIDRAMAVTVDGVNPFSTVQATWNLLETSAGPALERAHGAGWGVLIKEALANGRLLAIGDPRLSGLRQLAADRGQGMDAICLAAVLAQPWVDLALSGAVTVAQVESNAAALTVGLTPAELERLAGLAEGGPRYWAERRELAWS